LRHHPSKPSPNHYLLLGIGELLIGPSVPEGDGARTEALEALFGAIYLDQGFEKARALAERHLLG
jgi:dsRNA-specific ribonuclease